MIIYFLVFVQFILLLIAIGIVLYMGLIMISFRNPVPYVPTTRKVIRKMIEAANIKKGAKAVDLGSGTGRIIFAVVRKYSVEAIGIERSWLLYSIARLKSFLTIKKGKIRFIRGDFRDYSLRDVDIVFCFLTPEGLRDIQDKLARELSKGSRFISYLFALEKKRQFQETKLPIKEGRKTNYIFFYNKL